MIKLKRNVKVALFVAAIFVSVYIGVLIADYISGESKKAAADRLLQTESEIRLNESRALAFKEECALKTVIAESDYEERMRIRTEKEEAEKRVAEEAWRKDGHAAMQLINHVNWVVTKILHYNDPVVLEREYNSINQNGLRLDTIHDQETIDTIKAILDVVISLRIDAKDRELLQEDLDDDMAENLQKSIPDISSVISLNPYRLAANVAGAAFSGYMNYQRGKKKLLRKHKKATWELDKTRMKFLNDLNKELLVKHWMLVERYKLNDEHRVVEDDLVYLINRLKDINPKRKLKFLDQNMETYRALPIYWFYRAQSAYQALDGDEESVVKEMRRIALESIEEYFKVRVDILRHDRTLAMMAMMRIQLYGDDAKNHIDDIRRLVAIIERNALPDDWSLSYFAALTRFSVLGEKECAIDMMTKVVDEFEFRRDNKLVEWKGNLDNSEIPKAEKKLPGFQALMQCQRALANMKREAYGDEAFAAELKALVRQENLAERDKLYLYGMVKLSDVMESIAKDVREIRLETYAKTVGNDSFRLHLPYTWRLNNDQAPRIFACKNVDSRQDGFEIKESKRGMEHREEAVEETFCYDLKIASFFNERNCKAVVVSLSFGDKKSGEKTLFIVYPMRLKENGKIDLEDEQLAPVKFYLDEEVYVF